MEKKIETTGIVGIILGLYWGYPSKRSMNTQDTKRSLAFPCMASSDGGNLRHISTKTAFRGQLPRPAIDLQIFWSAPCIYIYIYIYIYMCVSCLSIYNLFVSLSSSGRVQTQFMNLMDWFVHAGQLFSYGSFPPKKGGPQIIYLQIL